MVGAILNSAQSFNTSLGSCYLTDKSLIYIPDNMLSRLAERAFGARKKAVARIFRVALACAFILLTLFNPKLLHGFLILGILVLLVIISLSFEAFTHSSIKRSAVTKIIINEPFLGFVRGRMIIYFLENGVTKKRVVVFPGVLRNGKEQVGRAKQVLFETGLLA